VICQCGKEQTWAETIAQSCTNCGQHWWYEWQNEPIGEWMGISREHYMKKQPEVGPPFSQENLEKWAKKATEKL
jgi:hypothetical protein